MRVSLVRCLDVLEQQTTSPRLKEIIRDIEQEVQGGATLSRSMAKFPRVFTNLTVGLVRAGEVGGVLDETLDRLAGFLENDMELRRKVKSAMTYPVAGHDRGRRHRDLPGHLHPAQVHPAVQGTGHDGRQVPDADADPDERSATS